MDEELSPQELLAQIKASFSESRRGSDKQLEEVFRQLQNMAPQLQQLQRDVLALQVDLKTQFVSRTEYEPRHQALLDKQKEYDRIILDARPRQEAVIRMQATQEAMKNELDVEIPKKFQEINDRINGSGGRVAVALTLIMSALALVLTFLSHVNFK